MYRVQADIVYLTGHLAGIVLRNGIDVPYASRVEALAAATAIQSRATFTSCVTGDTYEKASAVSVVGA